MDNHQAGQAFVSVVVPLLDEGPTFEALCRRMSTALEDGGFKFENRYVDDGSTDDSAETMRANFAKSAALAAGIRTARHRRSHDRDADLQERPEEITRLLAKLAER
jgi:glycosyltransferase involved in cell wall biosynthesis